MSLPETGKNGRDPFRTGSSRNDRRSRCRDIVHINPVGHTHTHTHSQTHTWVVGPGEQHVATGVSLFFGLLLCNFDVAYVK